MVVTPTNKTKSWLFKTICSRGQGLAQFDKHEVLISTPRQKTEKQQLNQNKQYIQRADFNPYISDVIKMCL